MTGGDTTRLTHTILERLAAELTPRQFDAFLLRSQGWTYEEIGVRLNCSKQTAHGHHRAAVRHLERLQRGRCMADELNPILRAVQRAAEAATIAASERKAWNEAAPADRLHLLPGTSAGDEERLRKLPVAAPGGWGGVIPGTHPEREAIRRVTAAEKRGKVRVSRRGP